MFNKIAYGALRDATPKGSSLMKYHTLSQYTCEYYFKNTHKNMEFPAPICRKLTSAQLYYMRRLYTEFNPDWTINVEKCGQK